MGTTVYSSGNTLKPVADAVAGLFSVVTGITAYAGGGQGSATQLTGALNSVDTVATAADSVKLPVAVAGISITIVNTSANSLQVFGYGTDTINAVATGTGVAQAAGKTATYHCTVGGTGGKWFRDLSA